MLNLNSLVFREVVLYHLAAKSLRRLFLQRLAYEELVAHFLKPLIFEMVAEVKQLDDAVLEAHDHVPVERNYASFILLKLYVVLAALSCKVNIRYLCSTKWL